MPDDATSLYVAEPLPDGGGDGGAGDPVPGGWPPALYVPGAAAAPGAPAAEPEAPEAEAEPPAEATSGTTGEPEPARRLREALEADPDFPSEGRYVRDLEPALGDPEMLEWISERMAEEARELGCDHLCAAEPVGVVLGAVAGKSGLPLVQVQHPEVGEGGGPLDPSGLELREGALGAGDRVLLIDERLTDGRVLARVARLVEAAGAEVAGIATVVEVEAAGGRERLEGRTVTSLLVM